MIDARSTFVNKVYGAAGEDSSVRREELKERCRASLTVVEFRELSLRSFNRGVHGLFSVITGC